MEWNLENSYLNLPSKFYTATNPQKAANPEIVLFNNGLREELGLSAELNKENGIAILAGNELPPGTTPIAQAYAGHQFGNFTMLGDGRAILLGEQMTPDNKRIDIQLKGGGETPFSRGGDGRAALGPMIREYIISEAMHHLGIPTTRSLAVVKTGEDVHREITLDGAIVVRTAESHLRVGTFQYAAAFGEIEDVIALADYAIDRHYPEVKSAENPYEAFLLKVIERQAALIAKWQLVGFIHGVMNTDNMTISGETIDYGPCAFMDTYHQKTVFSSIDINGRYAYMNQPSIGGWNLARFAEAILPLLANNKDEAIQKAQEAISSYQIAYRKNWYQGMRAKLGLFNEEANDEALIESLLSMMQHYQVDYTNTFLALTFDDYSGFPMAKMDDFQKWKQSWQERIGRQNESEKEAHVLMKNHNPALIPRNAWVEEAIEAAVNKDNYEVTKSLVNKLENPFAHTKEQQAFARKKISDDPSYQTYCGT
ncbi:protein adenylyltransferase SelO [Oceanobacillus sp. CAU 1775]